MLGLAAFVALAGRALSNLRLRLVQRLLLLRLCPLQFAGSFLHVLHHHGLGASPEAKRLASSGYVYALEDIVNHLQAYPRNFIAYFQGYLISGGVSVLHYLEYVVVSKLADDTFVDKTSNVVFNIP